MSKRAVALAGAAVVFVAAAVFTVLRFARPSTCSFPSPSERASPESIANEQSPAQPISVSKVENPPPGDGSAAGAAGQGQRAGTAVQGQQAAAKKANDPFDYGKTLPVRGDANAQVASAVEAVKTKSHPERLSVLAAPKPFDSEAYRADPASYLNVVEPGRALQPKQPGPGVARIRAASATHVTIAQGEGTVLRVQALPKFPVTWTSWDLGQFTNKLTSITVEADENGWAETQFSATPGTIADVHILCASPVTSGQVRYTISVTKPE